MFKNLLLGVSLIVTAANISPAQAKTPVVSKTKVKIKGSRSKRDATLTQLLANHGHASNLRKISSVISDTALERETTLNLERKLNPKGDVRNKIGFFNSFFGLNKSKGDVLKPAVKKGRLTQKNADMVTKGEPGDGSVQAAASPQKSSAVKAKTSHSTASIASPPKTSINQALASIQLRKYPARLNLFSDKAQNSAPWVNQLTPSLIKAVEKSKKTEVTPPQASPLNQTFDLTPVSEVLEDKAPQIQSPPVSSTPPEERTTTGTLRDDSTVTSSPVDTSNSESVIPPSPAPTPISPIKESETDEPQLPVAPPPPPPVPSSGRTTTPKNSEKAHEGSLGQLGSKMDQAGSISDDKGDDRSNLLAAIRQGKTLKKTEHLKSDLTDDTAITRIDQTIINTIRSDSSTADQGNGLFTGLFRTFGNFFSGKSTDTVDDPNLIPPEGARFKDYSVSYMHSMDDGFNETTFVVYFVSEAAKKSYINKISSFDDDEDRRDFAESYSLSPAQTHIRQLHEKREAEASRLENEARKAQLARKSADETEQRQTTEVKITAKPAPAVTPTNAEAESSEPQAPTATSGGILSGVTHDIGDMLSSIRGFTLTSLKKVTTAFKPAEKPKDNLADKMLNRRKKMGYEEKKDLDWD